MLVVGAGAATTDPSISSKRDQAQAILAQIRDMDSDLSHAIESYNLANVQLGQIDTDLETNGRHLDVAKSSLTVAQTHIAKRLRALYINGDAGGAVEVILGAKNLDDLLDRLDMAQRVGGQDSKVLRDVKRFRHEVQTRREKLRSARERQAQVVDERAAQRGRSRASWPSGSGSTRRSRTRSSAWRRRSAPGRPSSSARRAPGWQQQRRPARRTDRGRSRCRAILLRRRCPSGGSVSANVPPAKYGGVVGIAMQYLGVPYVWGGASPSGFDCSGLVMYVYAQVGVSLPHNAAMQYNSVGVFVSRDQLQPGDLVFFDGLGHMGMYIGGGQFIHAPHTGDVVKISSLYDSWYASTYVGAKRVL